MATLKARVVRQGGRLLNSSTFGIAGLMLLFGSGPSWAGGPPNPTPSDALKNTAGGGYALYNNIGGEENTAFGYGALFSQIDAAGNTASGVDALYKNTFGQFNTASGYGALYFNTTGSFNTASGFAALFSNTVGLGNTASGAEALTSNTTGSYNAASGYGALYANTTGAFNTASGLYALYGNSEGSANSAFGYGAGQSNIDGIENTFIGSAADTNAVGYMNGTALGYGALLTASSSIVLGNRSISRIYANVTTITAISDRRRKKDIRALDADLGLDFIEKLKPVFYRFNNGDETERYGFVAQDLEQALPASLHDTVERSEPEHGLALIERQNDNDRTYRVSYGELTAPIVKAIQQQQQEIADLRQALKDQAAAFKAENDALRHWIETLRVSAAR
jgi:hypothetical protein